MANPKILCGVSVVALVVGLVIVIGVLADVIAKGETKRDEMVQKHFSPPPPPSPAPSLPASRRLSSSSVHSEFKLTEREFDTLTKTNRDDR
tara:strand:- start:24 stop:296 length:273 start_codon:yes stop_codon:yes gene_type:complete